MARDNEGLAREIVVEGIAQGYWLYISRLDSAMETERMRSLLPGDEAFQKIRTSCSIEGELSMARLRKLAHDGELDELTKEMIRRLFRYGDVHDWMRMKDAERRVFNELAKGGGLNELLKVRVEETIRHGEGRVYALAAIRSEMKELFDGLVSSGDLNTVLREKAEEQLRNGYIDDLQSLVWAVRGTKAFNEILGTKELDTVVREQMKDLLIGGRISHLKWLVETAEGRRIFDDLMDGNSELKKVLKEKERGLMKADDLEELYVVCGKKERKNSPVSGRVPA